MNDKPILLVEDNPDDVDLTLRAFRKSRIQNEIVTAGDGEEALEYLFGTGRHAGRDPARLPAVVFVGVFARQMRKAVRGVSPEASAVLAAHDWPGNIRELRNAVETACILAEGDLLGAEDFPNVRGRAAPTRAASAPALGTGDMRLEHVERAAIERAVAAAGGNLKEAARLLGIGYGALRYRLKDMAG